MHMPLPKSLTDPADADTVSIYIPLPPASHLNRSIHTQLGDRAAHEMMNALAYSLHIGKRFTHHISIHLEGAGVTSAGAQNFILLYLRRLGDLIDLFSEGPRMYFWVLENPSAKGLHFHVWVRVPQRGNLRTIFRERADGRWLSESGGTPGDEIVKVVHVGGREDHDPLEAYLLDGLEYGASYLFKGWEKHEAAGIKVREKHKCSQGVIYGKRSATSKCLGKAARESDPTYTTAARLKAFSKLGWKAPRRPG